MSDPGWLAAHMMGHTSLLNPYEPENCPHCASLPPGQRIGVDCHSIACVDEEGKVECVCGLEPVE